MYKNIKSLLEIGFDGGASLQAYADFFNEASIYGIDIEDNLLDYVKRNPKIKTYIADAKLPSTISHFGNSFDMIIEDASHFLDDQIQHFKDYADFVNPGGIYVIEDVNENNKDALEKALKESAKEKGFTLYIYDLRSIKNRFDDILFVFQKQGNHTILCNRFLDKLSGASESVLKSCQAAIEHVFTATPFKISFPQDIFFHYFFSPSTSDAKIFFTHLYDLEEWRLFCELFLYPALLQAPYRSFWDFPLQDYLCVDKPLIPKEFTRVSLDVGMAFNGPNTSEWVKNPSMFVLGFEPNPTNLRCLHQPFDQVQPPANYPYDKPQFWLDSKYIGKQVQIYPLALSDQPGTCDFYCTTNDPGTSSMYKPVRFGVEAKVTVNKTTLDSVLVHFPWDRIPYIDHLKIDAQGHDFEILLGSLSYIDRIAYVNVEMNVVGQYEEVPNKFPLIHAFMEAQGFQAYNSEGGNCSYVNTKILDYVKTFRPQFIDL